MKTKILISVAAALLVVAASCNKQETSSQETSSKVAGSQETSSKVAGSQVAGEESVDSDKSGKHGTIKLTREDFLARVMNYEVNQSEWVFEGDKPCVIDFYADWCAPCRVTSPILEELAVEYGDKINIYKIDTQREQELAAVFGIQSIPTFLFCPMEGKPVMSSGIAQTVEQTKEMFKQQIDEYLLKDKAL